MIANPILIWNFYPRGQISQEPILNSSSILLELFAMLIHQKGSSPKEMSRYQKSSFMLASLDCRVKAPSPQVSVQSLPFSPAELMVA